MEWWDSLWAWTRDEAVWESLRTLLAALLGAVVGGVFTLAGQARQAKTQRELQADTNKLQEELQKASGTSQLELQSRAHEAASKAAARAASLSVAREVFDRMTSVYRAIQEAEPSLSDLVQGTSWHPEWRMIWTPEVSLEVGTKVRLIAGNLARRQMQGLTELLDQAEHFTSDEAGNNPHLPVGLRTAAKQLTEEAIDCVGAYLRGGMHRSARRATLNEYEGALQRFEEWQEWWVQTSIEAAEAAQEAAEPENAAEAQRASPPEPSAT